ncbi:MAG: winged helix-turn-helix domain-containing protein, partial [Thermoanaerobaculia bacterium]
MNGSDPSAEEPIRSKIYRFGPYRLDASKRKLYRDENDPIPLKSKVFDTLLYLVRNQQRVIEKDELMREIWSGTIVEENNLNKNISVLRRLLGETKDEHRFIVTIPGRGYQFVAEVCESDEGGEPVRSAAMPAESKGATSGDDAELPKSAAGVREPSSARGSRLYLVALAAAVSLAAVLAWMYWWREDRAPVPGPIRIIAVLPFQSLVPEARDEAMELGMADALINKISSSEEIVVRPLSSVRRYGFPERDALAAGRELGADAVLEGTIQTSDQRTRIAARLIRTVDGKQIWTARFDEQVGHLFDVQDSISERVLAALTVKLGSDAQRRLRKRQTENVEAYQLYMTGRFHQSTLVLPQATRSAELYRRAIALDPDYALAYVGLSDAYRIFALSGDVDPRIALKDASDAAARAIELDPHLAESQVASGMVSFWYEWNWRAAEEKYRLALELDPHHPPAYVLAGHLFSSLGRGEAAIALGKRARELDPLSLIVNSAEAQFLFYARRHDDALARLDRVLELEPDFWHAHLVRSLIFADRKMFSEALASGERASRASGGNSQALAARGYALAGAGDLDAAREVLGQLQAQAATRHVPPYSLATIHNAIGQSEEALDLLERGFRERDPLMVFIGIDRRWSNLRGHPRFEELLRRMQLD